MLKFNIEKLLLQKIFKQVFSMLPVQFLKILEKKNCLMLRICYRAQWWRYRGLFLPVMGSIVARN